MDPVPESRAERRRVYRLMSRIYALLNSGEWSLRYACLGDDPRLRDRFDLTANTVGFCDAVEQVLYVDPRKDVLATIIHECLHAIFPEKDECEIIELEEMVVRRLTARQATTLHLVATAVLEY